MVNHASVRRALARAIRQQRTIAGMSQRQLAAQVGVSAAFIGRVERGKADISAEAFVRIAHVLKVDPVKLLGQVVKRS
jgi:transcriptional regulator with XRE-family HTH domain